jgi:hypothetical protein
MLSRALPAPLAFTALAADLAGNHGLAAAALLGAIPAAFAFALACYGDALEARCGGARPLAAAGGLLLLVLSAALRSPAVVGGVPRLAVSAIVLCLILYAGQALAFLLTAGFGAPSARTRRPREVAPEAERLADAA